MQGELEIEKMVDKAGKEEAGFSGDCSDGVSDFSDSLRSLSMSSRRSYGVGN